MPELNEPVLPPVDVTASAETPAAEIAPASEALVVETPVPVPESPSWPMQETRLTPPSSSSRRLPVSVWLAALLIPYAIGATIGIGYLLQQQQRNRTSHILESIPDQGLYEDFFDGRRRDVQPPLSKASEKPVTSKIIPPTEPVLPEMTPLKLGESRKVGMLTVKPLSISKRRLQYSLRAGKSNVPGDEVLVLTLSVKNEGPLIFRPDDETFNRAYLNEGRTPVYTFLEWGKEQFYGAVADPTTERLNLPSVPALQPGESAEIQVVADRNSTGTKLAVDQLKPGEQGLWRVHLRKGKEEITMHSGKKRSVWVTTVVPIAFSTADVK